MRGANSYLPQRLIYTVPTICIIVHSLSGNMMGGQGQYNMGGAQGGPQQGQPGQQQQQGGA